jgi:hypothetical protein
MKPITASPSEKELKLVLTCFLMKTYKSFCNLKMKIIQSKNRLERMLQNDILLLCVLCYYYFICTKTK